MAHVFISFLPSARGPLQKRSFLTQLQEPLGIQKAVKLDKFGHEPGPAGLVAGAKPRAVVAVEVFVEEEMCAPVRIGLEFLGAAELEMVSNLISGCLSAISSSIITSTFRALSSLFSPKRLVDKYVF
jgi:hypothetical protein